MRYLEIISEGRDAPLYHTMSYEKAKNAFEIDLMEAWWDHTIPGYGQVIGNSFTRNPKLEWHGGFIILTIDQSKLARTNKIIPLDGQFVHASTHNMNNPHNYTDRSSVEPETTLAEEFVVGDIKNLHRYILNIKVDYRPGSGGTSRHNSVNTYNFCNGYAKKWNVPLEFSPKFMDRLYEIEKEYDEEHEEEYDKPRPKRFSLNLPPRNKS